MHDGREDVYFCWAWGGSDGLSAPAGAVAVAAVKRVTGRRVWLSVRAASDTAKALTCRMIHLQDWASPCVFPRVPSLRAVVNTRMLAPACPPPFYFDVSMYFLLCLVFELP